MKPYLLFITLWSVSLVLQAQIRDLDYYLEQAERNSPLINRSANESELISLDMQQVRSILAKPEINLEGNIMFAPIVSRDAGNPRFEWVSDGATDYYGYDLALTDGGQYQAGISIRQPLFRGSVLQSYTDKADISQDINENNRILTVHEIEQLVGYQYILCLKAKVQTENNLALLEQLDEQLGVMKKLVENAVYKQTDLMLLNIVRNNYEDAFKSSRADYRDNIYDLNLLCGIRDTTLAEIRDISFRINAPADSVSRFRNVFRLDSLSLLAEQTIFEQKYKPSLSLFASAGLNASYLPTPDRFGISTGLSFYWTIFDGHQREIRQQITKVNLNTVEFEKMNFIRKTDIQKYKIMQGISAIEERETLAKDQLSQYDQLIDAYLLELSMGEHSIMDLKNLLNERAAKQQQLVALEMERFLLINRYNYWNY